MHYLAIQSSYETFKLALFTDGKLIDKLQEDKRNTSKLFILSLELLLSKNNIAFSALSFCAVNCGPAPFSTLRSIIASMNGLYCATNIPLVSIDGLEATFLEFYNPQDPNTAVLLNAFNNESYYLIAEKKQIITTGYKNTELLRVELEQQFPDNLNIIDNKICSIETIGKMGYEKFMAHETMPGYLTPLHLKKHPVEL